jgi:Icc protein
VGGAGARPLGRASEAPGAPGRRLAGYRPAAMLVQISDPHLRTGPDDQGAAAALAAAVARIRALPDRPDAVLVSGDVADSGSEEEYALARELLAPLELPVHLIAGNHDRMPERTQYAVRCGDLRLVACDTSVPGEDGGRLDVAWLAARLAENPRAPTIVAMHHHPVPIGIPWLDEIGLAEADRDALADLLRRSPQVRRVVAGHVHRSSLATLGGCPVFTCTSTNLQATLELGATTAAVTREPPSLLLHVLVGDGLVTHLQPVEPAA